MDYVIIGVIALLIILIIVYCIVTRNKLLVYKNNVKEAFSNIDVVLKKRYDLIPNIVTSVKTYMEHETKLLEDLTKLRSKEYESMSMNSKVQMDNDLNRLFAVAEGYPTLNTNQSFLDLSEKLAETERDISEKRIAYNNAVTKYNTVTGKFPTVLVAGVIGYSKLDLFVIPDKERESIKIAF